MLDTELDILYQTDDDEELQRVKRLLRGISNSVTQVRSCSEAIQQIKARYFGLYIIDSKLASRYGFESVRFIHDHPSDYLLSIIAVTDSEDLLDSMKYLRGVDMEYVSRPIQAGILRIKIEHSMEVTRLRKGLREAQERSLESEKLASIGLMAMGIMHELSTPITVLNSSAVLLQKKIEENPEFKEIEAEVEKVARTSQYVIKVVRNVRNISRDTKSEDMQKVTVHGLVDNALSIMADTILSHEVKIIKTYTDQPDVHLELNGSAVIQVLLNLITNSCHAIEDSADKWIEVFTKKESETVKIYVKDCGSGIPKSEVRNIFKPFFTTKEVGKGTGLGLPTSKKMAQSVGGDLDYDVDSDHTCFVITLPL